MCGLIWFAKRNDFIYFSFITTVINRFVVVVVKIRSGNTAYRTIRQQNTEVEWLVSIHIHTAMQVNTHIT